MMNDAFERGNDAAKNFREFAAGHQNVVDLEKHLKPVPLER